MSAASELRKEVTFVNKFMIENKATRQQALNAFRKQQRKGSAPTAKAKPKKKNGILSKVGRAVARAGRTVLENQPGPVFRRLAARSKAKK